MKKKPFRLPFRSEVELLDAINRLPASHRGIIARIIWWDWYASRLVCDRTDKFDQWLNERCTDEEPLESELSKSMQKMGYSKEVSDRRTLQKYKKVQITTETKEA